MGNCTSKKSEKLLKVTSIKKPINLKMDKDQDNNNSKGLSKKIAPFTKGEVTSFGFRRKPNSSLPVPVTLTSNNGNADEKKAQNGSLKNKDIIDDCHSGSSIESLCHNAPLRSTPKMIRKKDLAKQAMNAPFGSVNNNNNNPNLNNENTGKPPVNSRVTFNSPVIQSNNNQNNINGSNSSVPPANRFGFRQQVPPRLESDGKTGSIDKRGNNLGPYDTGTYRVVRKNDSPRSKSEGPREAFFKQTLQPAGSAQSVLSQSRTNLTVVPQPGKFTLQTSHLPRPQFPVRMPDAKTAKTVTNYYRRAGPQSDSNSSKEGSLNGDSGFESQTQLNKHEAGFESPGYNVRRRLQTAHGKKLEMKIVGNKFELLDKSEEKDSNVVTEVSLIKLPMSGVRAGTAIINTGLVEQRTNQYLKRISQNNRKDNLNRGFKSNSRVQDSSSDSSHVDEGFGAESEEEKLFKDRNRSEKTCVNYLMNDDIGDEDLLPGEAMAEDVSLSFSSDDETSAVAIRKKPVAAPRVNLETDITPNTIRLDALKLSKQLKRGNAFMVEAVQQSLKIDDSSLDLGTSCEPDDETFPSESILEQLSSDSDSFGDKGENKDNDKEKSKPEDDIEIEELEEDPIEKKTGSVDLELDLNVDEKELMDIQNNSLEPSTPDSPGTPTNASNSLSLSEGRDFLIDDEIADQPQLCLTETYPDCSCQEEVRTCNEKTITSSGNNEFLSCVEAGVTLYKNESTQAASDIDDRELMNIEANCLASPVKRERRLNSGGTLSPCDSLTSDDLMLDFESSACDENSDRLHSVNGQAPEEVFKQDDTFKDLRPLSSQKNSGMGGGVLLKSRTSGSTPGSPRSCDAGVPSPLRHFRPGDDETVKIDKSSYENMFQDIAGIKKMLLKLRQVLSESEADSVGILGSEEECSEEMSDLRRQVTFLQQQLEEREKTVQSLQQEISKTYENSNGSTETRERCNAATQTDRVRPISTGPSMLHSLPSDSGNLVSNHFTNSRIPNSVRGHSRIGHDERNTKGFVSVRKSSPHVEKIMEKVKELSFKPVEVLEKEEEALKSREMNRGINMRITANGLLKNNPIFNRIEVKDSENCRKPTKNVFKITKIDLVLKSDNYGKNHLTQSNR